MSEALNDYADDPATPTALVTDAGTGLSAFAHALHPRQAGPREALALAALAAELTDAG